MGLSEGSYNNNNTNNNNTNNNNKIIILSFDVAPFPYNHAQRRKVMILEDC